MEISIINEQSALEIDEKIETMIEDLVQLCLESESIEMDGEVSIMFVDDKEIHALNKVHRNKDSSTDVLSFPQYDDLKSLAINDPYVILGDVVISTETAMRQAEEYNHPLEREIGFLLVHSMFHLFGYDHDTEEHTKEMRLKEEQVLTQYNLTR
ncbi:MAG: rRNA maturation RNase YbeY [Clostridia bacterium]|nr:rRNA maturation RNase YbeY [Clostridia bacterium]